MASRPLAPAWAPQTPPKLPTPPQVFLTMRPEDVLTAAHALADALRAPLTAARALALAEPRLLRAPPAGALAALAELRELLDGGGADEEDPQLLPRLVSAAPSLLLPGAAGAARRRAVAHLAAALGAAPAAVARAAVAAPRAFLVLGAVPGNAAAALRALLDAGIAPEARLREVLLAQPALMHQDPQVCVLEGGAGWGAAWGRCFGAPFGVVWQLAWSFAVCGAAPLVHPRAARCAGRKLTAPRRRPAPPPGARSFCGRRRRSASPARAMGGRV